MVGHRRQTGVGELALQTYALQLPTLANEGKTAMLKSLAQRLRLPKPEDALPGYDFMRKMDARKIYPHIVGVYSFQANLFDHRKIGHLVQWNCR